MSDAALAQIVGLLPKLNAGEIAALQTRLKAVASITPAAASEARESGPARPDIDWLLEGVFAVLRSRGQLGAKERPPRAQLLKIAPNYEAQVQQVRRLIDRHLPQLTALEEAQLGRLCAEALADYITRWTEGPPVSLMTLMRNAGRLPEAIEASFPGYMRSGLLRIVLKRAAGGDR